MSMQTEQDTNKKEISLFDVIITILESWRLLVFGPIVVGILTFGVGLIWPKTFESTAILRVTDEEVAILHATPVLDKLIENFGLLKDNNGIWEDARQNLKESLTYRVDKRTKLTTISAKGSTPEMAQMLAANAIELMIKELQIKGLEKELIDKKIAINERSIKVLEEVLESINNGLKKGELYGKKQEVIAESIVVINSDIANRSLENEELRFKGNSRGQEIYVQKPNLPQLQSYPKVGYLVIGALLLTELLILIFLLMRNAIRKIKGENQEERKKIDYIKSLIVGGESHEY
jgi:uncharacterized protein involved in exopolysaccharide biosynthesis